MTITLENSRIRQETRYGNTFDGFDTVLREYFLGHLIEEIGEARKYIPRKKWKDTPRHFANDKGVFREYLDELVDIHLFIENFLLATGFTEFDFSAFYAEYSNIFEEPDFHEIIRQMNLLVLQTISPTAMAKTFGRILNASQIFATEFEEAYTAKVEYNKVRSDHKEVI